MKSLVNLVSQAHASCIVTTVWPQKNYRRGGTKREHQPRNKKGEWNERRSGQICFLIVLLIITNEIFNIVAVSQSKFMELSWGKFPVFLHVSRLEFQSRSEVSQTVLRFAKILKSVIKSLIWTQTFLLRFIQEHMIWAVIHIHFLLYVNNCLHLWPKGSF